MTGRLEGKVAVVTGAAGGMGAEEARRLAAEGARVVVADRSANGTAVAEEIGEAAIFVELDVTSSPGWHALVERTEAAFGPIDILVNNAAIVAFGGVREMSEETFRDLMEVNTLGVFLGMKHVAESMIRAGGGSIVNISSIGGMAGSTLAIGYTASKWAVRGMTKSAALQLGPLGIRVNSVHPGWIDTPMHSGNPPQTNVAPVGRIGSTADVASLVAFLASDESGFISGTEHVIDGGQLAGYPDLRPNVDLPKG